MQVDGALQWGEYSEGGVSFFLTQRNAEVVAEGRSEDRVKSYGGFY